MKYLLVFLITFMNAAQANQLGATEYCEKLVKIIQHYESTLQWKHVVKEDDEGKKSEEGICDPSATLAQVTKTDSLNEAQKNLLNPDYACASLAAVEARIAQLENEQSLLTGFHKLKADIKANKKEVSNQDEKKAQQAGLNFVDGLITAQALEQLLPVDGNFLKAIKGMEAADRSDPNKVKAFVANLCKADKNTSQGPCKRGNFNPNKAALNAINELINHSELSSQELQNWASALKIKKPDGQELSFSQLAAPLQKKHQMISEGRLGLSREELESIEALEDFKDAGPINLSSMKKDIKIYQLMQEYRFHVKDLASRQAFEIQSKVSLAFNLAKDKASDLIKKLGPEELTACQSGFKKGLAGYDEAIQCLHALNENKDHFTQSDKAKFEELKRAIEVSTNYMGEQKEKHAACLEVSINEEFKAQGELPQACLEALEKTDARLSDISSEIQAMNALKGEIGRQNQEEIKTRNLALATLKQTPECESNFSSQNSSLQCNFENLTISQNAEVLISTLANVHMLLLNKEKLEQEEDGPDNSWPCNDEESKIFGKEVLCGTPKPKVEPVVKNTGPQFRAPLAPSDSGRNSPAEDAALHGLGHLVSTAGSAYLASRQQNYNFGPSFNPYQYNYAPYSSPYAMMGIGDQILYSARNQGAYGYYWPAPGLQPYQAFGSGIRPYSSIPYGQSRSPYFTGRYLP